MSEKKEIVMNGAGVAELGFPGWPQFDPKSKAEIAEALDTGAVCYWTGHKGMEFEDKFAKWCGAKMAISCTNGTAALHIGIATLGIGPGDEVIVPSNTFIATALAVSYTGATPVFVEPTLESFDIDPARIEEKITDKTKILVMPFPNNPTGAIMTKEDLAPIVDIIIKKDLFVISDEIYSELTYGTDHVTIAAFPEMKDRTILINGFSKSHAMTGWRLGYACGPAEIIKQMIKIHQFAIMCAPTTSQYAAVEAMRNGDEDVQMMREEYNGRRRYLMQRFKEMGLSCFEPFGAFYVFPCIKEFGMTSDEFANKLLQSKKVAVVPGTAFGASGEGFIRISYAYSLEDLKLALSRVEEFINELRAAK